MSPAMDAERRFREATEEKVAADEALNKLNEDLVSTGKVWTVEDEGRVRAAEERLQKANDEWDRAERALLGTE